ncbi:hypothetical protein CDAR_583281, partial [Caerostris darwini]
PTFDCSRGQSWIDLILSKNFNQDLDLAVSDEISNSDHRLLQLTWEPEKTENPPKIGIRMNQSNWQAWEQTTLALNTCIIASASPSTALKNNKRGKIPKFSSSLGGLPTGGHRKNGNILKGRLLIVRTSVLWCVLVPLDII